MKVITLKTLFKGHLKSKNNFTGQDPAGTNMIFNILFHSCCQPIQSKSKHQRCLLF